MAVLLLKVLFLFFVIFHSCNALDCSTPDNFKCQDGTCIKSEYVCDGKIQCPDGSDEEDCGFKMCKAPKWYQCADNKTCIVTEFVCDGYENCPMGDDEENCDQPHQHQLCNKYEFKCSDKTCIPLDMTCDGHQDCSDNSDETVGCIGIEERCHGFLCRNKHCLESHTWVCDGYDDCGDGSDESGCVTNCKIEDHKYLCKDNDSCISLDKLCDNFSDCSDKSDEGGMCKNEKSNCSSLHCPSPSVCHIFPSGSTCICPKGYYFDELKNQCKDVDECQNYGVCSQGCQNKNGSYECTCGNKFKLERDRKTCVVRGGEPLLLYTTQKTVVGMYLKSRHVYHVAENLSQVIGIDFDGTNIYWTDIKHQSESIVTAREDGSHQEILLTSGLESPEDLAIDWLTNNIYFTDNIMKHIAVCSNHGFFCAILVVKDVDQPRGIALNPPKGVMFWTDWGKNPMIGMASMDGSNEVALITSDIHWPNGISLDIPNGRIYWVDAKIGSIESARMDGSDRRVVLKDILKHPYGIAVFEDKIYWSDWGTKSIHSCHKFSGKHHEILAKDRTIYDIIIYHSAQHPKTNHSCSSHRCSHLCLLAENNSFSCACPEGMVLGVDHNTCKKFQKKQRLYIGIANYLVHLEHSTFGRHKMAEGIPLPMYIHKIAFNSLNGTVFIADNVQKVIYEVHAVKKTIKKLLYENVGNVTALAFDYLANNLYWTDSQRHTVEVLSLNNMERTIVHHFSGADAPVALAIIPEEGKMFVTLRSSLRTHIDVQPLHGRGSHHHVVEESLGSNGMQMLVDQDSQTVFWLDTEGGKIEFSNYEGSFRHLFRTRLNRPVTMAIVDEDIVWSSYGSKTLHYTHKSNMGSIKKFDIELPMYVGLPDEMPIVASTPLHAVSHKCQYVNGGCSHICVSLGKFASACLCPAGMVFRDKTNMTCIDALDCEFRCGSGECLTSSRRCNGRKDCADGSDEKGCDGIEKTTKVCSFDQFACHDGTDCIPNDARCDRVFHCADKSDEEHCEFFDHDKKCHTYQHLCDNGRCIDLTAVCDNFDDCGDGSDEKTCDNLEEHKSEICGPDMFKCIVGPCIPKEWECDGHMDCSDGTDEHDKCATHECPEGSIKCKLGQCIDKKLVCDGHDDCGDNYDEMNCDAKVRQIVCDDEVDDFGDPIKFQCPSEPTMCLDIRVKCNGTAECPRGEDEFGCTGCSIHEFQCKSTKECIRKEFRCDSQKDCTDGSDEVDCQNHNSSLHHHFATLCRDGMFHCKDGTCIDQLRTCDGSEDCDGGEDEGPTCKTACVNHACQQKCTPSPFGAICSCNDGYRLNGDKKTCSDIDECVEGKPCAQICENDYGSYRCGCYGGFMLRPEKTSCKSIDGEHYLLFTSSNQVRKLSENPMSLKLLWSLTDTRISGLDVNVHKKKAYHAIQDIEGIFEYDLNNGTSRSIADVGVKSKIAVDWVTNNVYVIDYSGRYSIKACDFDKSVCVGVIKFSARDVVKTLAVDAVNKYIFYAVVHFHTFGDTKSLIYKSGLDGTKKEVLVSLPGFVTAIECDIYKKELYFIDQHAKTLQMINYKGGATKVIIKKENAIINPSGLSIFENTAFIVNTGSAEAVRCHLYGDFSCQAFNLNVYNSEDIVVVAKSRQKKSANVCKGNNCTLMCLQAELGPKCICHEGEYVQEGARCSTTPPPATVKLVTGQITESNPDDSSNGVTLGVCLFIMIIILMGLVGYIYHRRKIGRGKFNVNMHFQNPLDRQQSVENVENQNNSKMFRPIQRFLQGGSGCEISMDAKRENTFKSFNATTGTADAPDISDNESGDVAHMDDNPRARLVM